MSLLDSYRGLVCDLDGVVYRGPGAVPYAVASLNDAALPVVYATNNASRTPTDVASHLRSLGLRTDAGHVVTSSMVGARHLADRLPSGSPVLAVGGPGVSDALSGAGLRPVPPPEGARTACRAVLQGYGADVTSSDLAEAAYAVQSGALWVATNDDRTLPTERGVAPGNGTLVAAVRAACNVSPSVVGKPHPPLYLLCAEVTGVPVASLLAVGDRLNTDIAGAVTAGMDSALVLTGVDDLYSLALASRSMRPRFLVKDLRALGEDYEAPRRTGGWWHCGGDRRRIVAGRWEVSNSGEPAAAVRNGMAAIHHVHDEDGALDEATTRALVSQLPRWQ